MHYKIDNCTLSFKLSIKRNFVICYVVIPFESLTWIIERGALIDDDILKKLPWFYENIQRHVQSYDVVRAKPEI
jgi:hypothetical protein